MDTGNDPGRDEYGLPPVDIEIPDDARDLDRDVQAYHRELRAKRRHVRFRRLTGPLTRHGMVMPLVAACLAGTLLVGTLLTVLAGRQIPLLRGRAPFGTAPASAAAGTTPQGRGSRSAAPNRAAPDYSAPPATIPHGRAPALPDVQVTIGAMQVRLHALVPAVLAWIPASCGCAGVLRKLAGQAATARVHFYLVANAAVADELPLLARQAGVGHRHLVVDTNNALLITYGATGLTAILANADGSVGAGGVVRFNVGSNPASAARQFAAGLPALASGSRTATAAPAKKGVPPAS